MGLVDKLLGKSSDFNVSIIIHELQYVPLLSANFRCKWKIKGATSTLGAEIDLASLSPSSLSTGSSAGSGAVARVGSGSGDGDPANNNNHLSSSSREGTAAHRDDAAFRSSRDIPDSFSPPMSPSDARTPNPERTPTSQYYSSFSSVGPGSPNAPLSRSNSSPYESYFGRSLDRSASAAESALRRASLRRNTPSPSAPARAEPKGTTNYTSLTSYTAPFHRQVYCRVAIPLKSSPSSSSSKYQLQPSPVRLAIRQEIIDATTGKKEELKTGEVLLDLSQFVGQSKNVGVTKRYLLRDCKTNATLRVTVKMDWVGGEPQFIAPPLKSGQVSLSPPSSTQSSIRKVSSSYSVGLRQRASSSSSQHTSSITRSSSSSSINYTSTQSSNSPHSKRGWRPSFQTSSTPACSIPIGGGAVTVERSATEIVDSLFNLSLFSQPDNSSRPPLPKVPTISLGSNYRVESGDNVDSLVSSASPRRPGLGASAFGKEKEGGKGGWFSRAPVSATSVSRPTPTITPSMSSLPYTQSPRPSPNPRTDVTTPSSRNFSGASDASSARVRWDDNDGVLPMTKAPTIVVPASMGRPRSVSTLSVRSARGTQLSNAAEERYGNGNGYARDESADTVRLGSRGGRCVDPNEAEGGDGQDPTAATPLSSSSYRSLFSASLSRGSEGSSEVEWSRTWG